MVHRRGAFFTWPAVSKPSVWRQGRPGSCTGDTRAKPRGQPHMRLQDKRSTWTEGQQHHFPGGDKCNFLLKSAFQVVTVLCKCNTSHTHRILFSKGHITRRGKEAGDTRCNPFSLCPKHRHSIVWPLHSPSAVPGRCVMRTELSPQS